MGTITKALDLMNYFSRSRPRIGLGDFARLSGRDKATVHRHLVELERNGFVDRDPATRAYRLGPAVVRLAGVREATFPIRSVLRPVVEALADATGELAHASALQGDRLSPVVHADPMRHGTQVHFDEAELLPLHATASGVAALAFCDEALVARVLAGPLPAFTDATPTAPARLREMIDRVRRDGLCYMARGFDGEVASQGAPVFGPTGVAMGAIAVAVPMVRATPDRMQAIRPAIVAAAARATTSVGGTAPPDLAAAWSASPEPAEPQHQPNGS